METGRQAGTPCGRDRVSVTHGPCEVRSRRLVGTCDHLPGPGPVGCAWGLGHGVSGWAWGMGHGYGVWAWGLNGDT